MSMFPCPQPSVCGVSNHRDPSNCSALNPNNSQSMVQKAVELTHNSGSVGGSVSNGVSSGLSDRQEDMFSKLANLPSYGSELEDNENLYGYISHPDNRGDYNPDWSDYGYKEVPMLGGYDIRKGVGGGRYDVSYITPYGDSLRIGKSNLVSSKAEYTYISSDGTLHKFENGNKPMRNNGMMWEDIPNGVLTDETIEHLRDLLSEVGYGERVNHSHFDGMVWQI